MDQDRFETIARALGTATSRRGGLRAAVAGLLGAGLGAAALTEDGEARRAGKRTPNTGPQKRKRHACGPDKPCPASFSCQKVGRRRRCTCASGVECAGVCCAAGQTCESGACADPGPSACIAKGQPCKNVGRRCCAGLSCGSGQGGTDDVACYVAKTGPCETTADCTFGTSCKDGACAPLPSPSPSPSPSGSVANGGACTGGADCRDPEATCTTYADGSPAGTFCLLAAGKRCIASTDCVSEACTDGTCAGGAGACDVCASGCPYPTIQAAVADSAGKPADSTITIAPGTYVESISVTRNLTFTRCGDQGSVSWRGPSGAAIDGTAAPLLTQLTVEHIDFLVDGPGNSGAPAINLGRSAFSSYLNTTISDCTFGLYSGRAQASFPALQLGAQTDTTVIDSIFQKLSSVNRPGSAITVISDSSIASQTLLEITRCTFEENKHLPYGINPTTGGALYVRGAANAVANVDITDSLFKKNETGNIRNRGGAIAAESHAVINLKGSTVIEENVAGSTTSPNSQESGGGGIYAACAYNSVGGTVALDIASTVQIKSNVAQNGGGIATNTTGCGTATLTVTGAAAATISGNTPNQCATSSDGATWTAVSNCAF